MHAGGGAGTGRQLRRAIDTKKQKTISDLRFLSPSAERLVRFAMPEVNLWELENTRSWLRLCCFCCFVCCCVFWLRI